MQPHCKYPLPTGAFNVLAYFEMMCHNSILDHACHCFDWSISIAGVMLL